MQGPAGPPEIRCSPAQNLSLFGLDFRVHCVSLVYFFTSLFVLINVWALKRIEEPELVKRLADETIAYRKRTALFFPRLGPRVQPPA